MKKAPLLLVLLLALAWTPPVEAQHRRVVKKRPNTRVVVTQRGPTQRVVVIKKRPPKPRREVRQRRPSRQHVWVAGHWVWHHDAYVWTTGRWVVPPRPRAIWVNAVWEKRDGGWFFIAGRWR